MRLATLRLLGASSPRSFFAGLLLGTLCWMLLNARQGSTFTLVMAVTLVASGAASVVCLNLAQSPRTAAAPAARRWLAVIGLGVLAALHGLDRWIGVALP